MHKTGGLWASLTRTGALAAALALILAAEAAPADRSAMTAQAEGSAIHQASAAATVATVTAGQVGAEVSAAAKAGDHADVVAAATERAANARSANANVSAPRISPTRPTANDGTVGARPGWGCGDPNHTHSGPPGRPGATPPPGCDR